MGRRSYRSREIRKMLKADGWYEVGANGDDVQYKHATKPGRVTCPAKDRDIAPGTLRSIFRQAQWDWKQR